MKRLIILSLILLVGFTILYFVKSPPLTKENESQTPPQPQTESITTTLKECTGEALPELTEGPYYKANSPEKVSLYVEGISGTKLTLTGYVLNTNCQPIANAWLDFWQADGSGQYDNEGYRLRGQQRTDENGKYTLITVVPGEYPGRTPHIHVKLRANDTTPIITTQLFIPGLTTNETDSIYNDALLLNVKESGKEKTATYNFVINGN